MSTQRIVWLNGACLPENEAFISPFDYGLTIGNGCFETMVSCYRTPFAFTRHYNRLATSAERLGLKGLPSKDVLFRASKMLIEENKLIDPILVRMTVTGGVAVLGGVKSDIPCTVLVSVAQISGPEESCKVQTVPYTRNEKSAVAGLKTTSYIENLVALAEAHDKGAGEAILGNSRGNICEGTDSNIFWVKDGTVYTPPLESGPLKGITRALVMELCLELGIPAIEADAPMSELETLGEVFLASTTREIQPVVAIDGRRLLPGATTLRLRKAYKDMLDDDLDP